MKRKVLSIALAIAFVLAGGVLAGCEDTTKIQAAVISNISVSSAKSYGVGVRFLEDERLEGKYVDVQVKTDKPGLVTLWQENGEKYTINFAEADSWKSITTILVNGEEKPNTEKFEKFEQASSRRYLCSTKDKATLVFRVVVGDVEDNAQKTGQILVNSEPISSEYKLKVEGANEENDDY